MTLGGLLALFGLVLAIYGIAPPPQRVTLRMFTPMSSLASAFLASFVLIVIPEAYAAHGYPLSAKPSLLCSVTAFLLPVIIVLWASFLWTRARFRPSMAPALEELIKTSLLEGRFNELHRVLSKNLDRLGGLPESTEALLFNRRLVRDSARNRSFVHLQLLATTSLRELRFPRQCADITVRETLRAPESPVAAWIAKHDSADETVMLTREDEELIGRTLACPTWYRDTRAGYPVLFTALEALRSGEFDRRYNRVEDLYTVDQGRSSRATCPVFTAEKTFCLAIQEAVKTGAEGDFYVTDFLDLFRAIVERIRFDDPVWRTSYNEPPTPFAYLLNVIVHDLWLLSEQAAKQRALWRRCHVSWRTSITRIPDGSS